MRRTSIAVLGLLLAALLGFVAAGCGGGGKKNAAATTAATETTASSTTEAMTEATSTEAMTTEAMTTEATTTESTTTSGLSGLASAANCKQLADLGQAFSNAFTGAANSGNLKKEAQLLKQFADKTPSDIRADFETVADYMTQVADVVGNIKPGQTPDPATLAKLATLSKTLDQAKFTQAAQKISAWVTKNCHA